MTTTEQTAPDPRFYTFDATHAACLTERNAAGWSALSFLSILLVFVLVLVYHIGGI